MKIDVEGHELQVLKGARGLLAAQRIALIKAECAVDPNSDWHTPFFALCDFLLPLGYRLLGIYEQRECWQKKLPSIRMFDAAFVSKKATAAKYPEI